jgi:hypothetical protein
MIGVTPKTQGVTMKRTDTGTMSQTTQAHAPICVTEETGVGEDRHDNERISNFKVVLGKNMTKDWNLS